MFFVRTRRCQLAPTAAADLEVYLVTEVAATRSAGAIEAGCASMTWHCAEIDEMSPFITRGRIGLIVRGMKAEFKKPVVPKLPFQRAHIQQFMDMARLDD